MANKPKDSGFWQSFGMTLTVAVIVVGATKYINDQISALGTRVTKIEGAVKYLGDQQSDRIKETVRDLLASASDALPASPTVALTAVKNANNLLAQMKTEKHPADTAYFQETLPVLDLLAKKTNRPDVLNEVHAARISLAEVSSASVPSPPLPKEIKPIESSKNLLAYNLQQNTGSYAVRSSIITYPGITFKSNGAIVQQLSEGQEIFILSTERGQLDRPAIVDGVILMGGSQSIDDGITWQNVTFVNVHIRYAGHDLRLSNVRFINCTFDVPTSPEGNAFLTAVTLTPAPINLS